MHTLAAIAEFERARIAERVRAGLALVKSNAGPLGRPRVEAFETDGLHFAGSLDALNDRQHFADHLQPARQTDWVVYAKPPFAGPDQVLDYVGAGTRIGSPSLTSASSTSTRGRSGSATPTTAGPAHRGTRPCPGRDGVHPVRPPPRVPARLPPHAVLRPAHESHASTARGSVPAAAHHTTTDPADGRPGVPRLSGPL